MFVRPFVSLSVCITPAPTGRIYVKYYTGDFYGNICRRNPNLVTDGHKYQALQMRNYVFLLLPATLNRYKRALLERNVVSGC